MCPPNRRSTGVRVRPKEDPECSDGVDNDGDAKNDLADSDCMDAADGREATPSSCGLGPGLVLILPFLGGRLLRWRHVQSGGRRTCGPHRP